MKDIMELEYKELQYKERIESVSKISTIQLASDLLVRQAVVVLYLFCESKKLKKGIEMEKYQDYRGHHKKANEW